MKPELAVLAAAIDADRSDLPPIVARLIQHAPESFDDGRAGQIAVTVRTMRRSGEPVNFASVGEKHSQLIGFITSELAAQALPLSSAEFYAEPCWKEYQVRRAKSVAQELAQGLEAQPAQAASIIAAARAALDMVTEDTSTGLTIRKPDDILAMQFDDSDIMLGDRIIAEAQSCVIAGAGGTGKSRFAFQLVAAIVSGREFIGFNTGKPESRWLFLQTENSNRRLKYDLERVRRWLGDDWHKFQAQVDIHTIENDADGFVNLDSPENQTAIAQAIKAIKPDGIIIDPLNEFSIGDLTSGRKNPRKSPLTKQMKPTSEHSIVSAHSPETNRRQTGDCLLSPLPYRGGDRDNRETVHTRNFMATIP